MSGCELVVIGASDCDGRFAGLLVGDVGIDSEEVIGCSGVEGYSGPFLGGTV